MNHPREASWALICMFALGASPAFAQTWDPVKSDRMNNTAMGTAALANPKLDADGGCHNTASGADTLTADTSGSYNSATGFASLTGNLTGNNNTGFGAETLYSNRSGSDNTASGYDALYHNESGNNNAAFGASALVQNQYGVGNTAIGTGALAENRGSFNTALGYGAGQALSTGIDNIDIANVGVAGESHTLRLGTQGTYGIVRTFIAGIASSRVTGSAVYITSSGQLGVLASSERYKTNIEPMGTATERLAKLHPVSFKLKNDPSGTLQYGLIAEQVAKVYPELVIRGDDGQINGVRYEELTPMLLNEVQQQRERLVAQASELAAQGAQLAELKVLVAMLTSRPKDERVATR
jgi:trimeric autotransporter adhesin